MARIPLLVAVLAVAVVTAVGWSSNRATVPPSPKALEATLLAPCCWQGTLATHDSPVASELREEIESRSAKGETTAAIESDLVTRYGEKVRAMPSAGAFSNVLVIAIDVLIMAFAGLLMLLSRWRRAPTTEPEEASASGDDQYDARINAELADIDA